MTTPKVTLYIPAYNAERYISQCLEGVQRMTPAPGELFVIDDGSTDGTAAAAEKSGVRVIKHSANRGIAAARNTATQNASFDLIAHIDSDAVPEKDWLEKLLDAFDDDVAGVGGRLVEKFQDNLANRWRAVHMAQHWGDYVLENPTFLYGAGGIYRKSVLENIGGYDTGCRTNFEDNDLGLRLRTAGYRLRYTPFAVAQHLRRDTLESLLMTNWRWTRRPRDTTSLNYRIRKILVNFWTMGRKARRDWHERSPALFGLSLLVTFNNVIMDIRYFLTGREDPWWKPRRRSA